MIFLKLIWSFARLFVPLTYDLRYFRSEILKLIWFYPISFAPQQIKTSFFCIRLVEIWNFARLFVPLQPIF